MRRKSVFRDPDLCVDCKACVIACKVKHMSPPFPISPEISEPGGLNLLHVYQFGPVLNEAGVKQSFVAIACMHCEDAPCIKVCPTSAIYKESSSHVTLVKRESCIGCKACLWVCPYGAPSFDEEGKLALCDLCIDRLREGKKAACEASCQAMAIMIGSPEEIAEVRAKKAVDRIAKGLLE